MEQPTAVTQIPSSQLEQGARVFGWVRYFLWKEATPDKAIILDLQKRACWIGLALLLQSLAQIDPTLDGPYQTGSTWFGPLLMPLTAILPPLLVLGSFCAVWMACRPESARLQKRNAQRKPARWQHLTLGITLLQAGIGSILAGIALVMCFLPPQFSNDGASLDTNAAILLLQGRNPYTNSRILDVAREFAIQPTWTTPLRQGQFAHRSDYPTAVDFWSAFDTDMKSGESVEFESRVSYPALSFLTLVPFVLLKHYNVLPFYLLSYVLITIAAWRAVRQELRPWVLLLALANIPMWGLTIGLNLDIFYALLVTLAWLLRKHRWRSSLLLGLAMASKQTAWFFLPFYLTLIWRGLGLKEALYRASIAGGLGLAINLPFLLWNAQAWLAGILAPIADPMFPLGVGIVHLSTGRLLPYFPGWFYLALEVGALLVALSWYWRVCLRCPEAALLLAIVPLFFGWRSLPSYFCCVAYPVFVLMGASNGKERYCERKNSSGSGSWTSCSAGSP